MCVRTFTRWTCAECRQFFKQEQKENMCVAATKKTPAVIGACGRINGADVAIYDVFCPPCQKEADRLLAEEKKKKKKKEEDVCASSNPTAWTAIGNQTPVPEFIDSFPFIQHWALCVLDCDEIEPSEPSSRGHFLNAKYFDLSVSLESSYQIICSSRSYNDVGQGDNAWPEEAVKQISAVQDVGVTLRDDHWIFERGLRMSELWGTYRPLLWNCQHFAAFLAQMAIDTNDSAELIRTLLEMRQSRLSDIQHTREVACTKGMNDTFYRIVGPAAAVASSVIVGIWVLADLWKTNVIDKTYRELVDTYKELERLKWVIHWHSAKNLI
ncbi:hypothetical protein BHE90_006600 [Fusarium euwallaceae]|uniref:Uncharacterized protein n=1 Tax=Fusarium euwallaceae TaxID=1147111 RepID=A0A430LT88_9HYPO|nr:hypothetical protein BHE90_006600 [Fusarium euwallaceae]